MNLLHKLLPALPALRSLSFPIDSPEPTCPGRCGLLRSVLEAPLVSSFLE
jgi:hypothetical protein